MDDSILRKSFNEVLHAEVTQLRPGALADIKPKTVADADDVRKDNLRKLYDGIAKLTPEKAEERASEDQGLSALCFSGGGIRSATFNLGILRTLAEHKLIRKFDYLSSVSGGGYIASWLRTWIWREAQVQAATASKVVTAKDAIAGAQVSLQARIANATLDAVENALAERTADRDPLAPEPKQLDHLREYSNYLTPQLGLFSPDTWTLAAIAVRNLLLNWLVILPGLSIVTAVPLFVLLLVRSHQQDYALGERLFWAAIGVAVFASVATHMCRRFAKDWKIRQSWIVLLCVVPTCLAATLLSTAALGLGLPGIDPRATETPLYLWKLYGFVVAWCIGIPVLGWSVAEAAASVIKVPKDKADAAKDKPPVQGVPALWELVGLIFSGLVAAVILAVLVRMALQPLYSHPVAYPVLAFPTLLALYLLARTLFVAFAGLANRKNAPAFGLEDADREWWARLSGWILMGSAMWLILSVVCLYGTHLLRSLPEHRMFAQGLVAALGGISGIVTALLGASSKTAGSEASKSKATKPIWMDWVMALAAPVFAVCVFVLVAQVTIVLGELILEAATGTADAFSVADKGGHLPAAVPFWFLALPVIFLILIFLFGRIVNVNRFSLHGMYRNRLVRAYLGASNAARKPDLFTGFADDDNPSLHELCSDQLPLRPFPIINTTLNLVKSGDKLAWQQRKAESFSMTPLYCGNFYEGYRTSKKYGGPHGISVGTAVTISGAAANPNMGSNSSPAISFLLALFNLRLGAWLGNTNEKGDKTCGHTGPRQAMLPLVAELFGLTTAKDAYINLSDGGHFDNLGLYEVVLRRCRSIVVCDAGQDPSYSFEDLGNAIRKIRIDFGVEIKFDQAIRVYPRDSKKRGVYCATGTISYCKIDGANAPDGRIVYIKATLPARNKPPVPYDVFSYAHGKPAFPHESTADQWFSESQFESYRALGAHALAEIIGSSKVANVRDLIDAVDVYLAGHTKPQTAATPPV